MSFDKIFDLTAGVYFNFNNIFRPRLGKKGPILSSVIPPFIYNSDQPGTLNLRPLGLTPRRTVQKLRPLE